MKAVIIHEPHTPLKIEEVDLDEPKAGEVRVRLVGGRVCHSDYHRIDGHSAISTLPYVMGHEGAGIVQQTGPGVSTLSPGDHVVFSLTPQCGRCRNCAAGRPNLCEGFTRGSGLMADGTSRFSKDGVSYFADLATFSEETVVLESSLVKVRDDVPLEKACLIGCGVMTGVGAVLNRAKVETGSAVAIFGCGGVGLNVVQGAVLASASKIIAIDKIDFKLEKAGELGATHLVNADRDDPVERVLQITDGGADYAFEVVGFPQLVRQAFEFGAARRDGRHGRSPSGGGRRIGPGAASLPGPDPNGHLLWGRPAADRLPVAHRPVHGWAPQARRADYKVPAPGRDQRGL